MATLDVTRLRPSRTTVLGLVALLWAAMSGAVREFVWADLRGGMVRTDAYPRSARALVRAGFLLVFAMVGVLLAAEVLRGRFELLVATRGMPGRGTHVPSVLVPSTMFMLSVAWAFLLTGALRGHVLVRLLVAGGYVATTVTWMVPLSTDRASQGLAAAGVLAVVVVVTAVPATTRRRPGLEYGLLLGLVSGVYAVIHARLVETYRATGAMFFLSAVESSLVGLAILVTPLLVMIGLDVVDFAYRASSWARAVVGLRFTGVLVPAATALVVAWLLRQSVTGVMDGPGTGAVVGAGLVPVIAILGAVVLGAPRPTRKHVDRDAGEEAAERLVEEAPALGIRLAVGLFGWQLLLYVALTGVVAVVAAAGTGATGTVTSVVGMLKGLTSDGSLWLVVFKVAIVAAAAVLARRGRTWVALYLAVVGIAGLWRTATAPGAALETLGWDGEVLVTSWWLLGFLLAAAWRLVRRRLTLEDLGRLLFVGVTMVLTGGAEAVEDPFSPLFASAGIGLIAFGLVWDALTAGTWANNSSPRLPSLSRVLLYLGYVLLSVTIVSWSVVTHDLGQLEFFTGGASTIGFKTFGLPLLYVVYALLLTDMLRSGSTQAHSPDRVAL